MCKTVVRYALPFFFFFFFFLAWHTCHCNSVHENERMNSVHGLEELNSD